MSDKTDLKRIKSDLEDAQAEIETASKIDDSLGGSLSFGFRSLLAAVGQLFTRTNDQESKISKHDVQLKLIQAQISGLQREIHGLKISRGKAIAGRERALAKAQAAIDGTRGSHRAHFTTLKSTRFASPAPADRQHPFLLIGVRQIELTFA